MHISENRLEGSLLDTALKEILDECHNHLVTGTLSIDVGGDKAVLEIRAGAVDVVDFKGLKKMEALAALHELKDGQFELAQKLPDLSGELGTAASLEATTDEISIVKLMQLCEDNALSCSVTATTDDVTAVIRYKVGEIDAVEWNGEKNDDRIVDLVNLTSAKLRVEAPPLEFGILSWPTVRDDPTPAFIPLEEMAKGRLEPETKSAKDEAKAAAAASKKAKKAKKSKKAKKADDAAAVAAKKKADDDAAAEKKKADDAAAEKKKADDAAAEKKKADDAAEKKKADDDAAEKKKADDAAEKKKADDDAAEKKKADDAAAAEKKKKADEKPDDAAAEKKAEKKKADKAAAEKKKKVAAVAPSKAASKAAHAEPPPAPETSGAVVLLGLVVGLIVVAAGLVFALRFIAG